MKIHDENGTLLSIVVRNEDIKEGRNFLTDNSEEVQVAAFNFNENIEIPAGRKIGRAHV